jgi:uncharacterized protein YecE (DUF72 family)
MKGGKKIHIGTSGWHYQHWRGPFYPQDLPAQHYLRYYAQHFSTVEINNTFYRMPDKKTLVLWREAVPDDFLFALKAGRYITHMKKLKDASKPLRTFLEAVGALGGKMGPVLFQLPPHWKLNKERLFQFLMVLPEKGRYVFEFRDSSWFTEEVYAALRDAGVAFCIYHLAGRLSPAIITADFVYVRLHGPGLAYQGQYSEKVLAAWAEVFSAWSRRGMDVYCYFDNDQAGYAAQDALRLQALVQGDHRS